MKAEHMVLFCFWFNSQLWLNCWTVYWLLCWLAAILYFDNYISDWLANLQWELESQKKTPSVPPQQTFSLTLKLENNEILANRNNTCQHYSGCYLRVIRKDCAPMISTHVLNAYPLVKHRFENKSRNTEYGEDCQIIWKKTVYLSSLPS